MSALTDLFTSLANKIRSKLGTESTYTPAQAINAIDSVYSKGVSDTKVGTATAAHVLTNKTFTNSSSVGISGTMANNGTVTQTLNASTTSYTIPEGYHSGSGKVSVVTTAATYTSSASKQVIDAPSGKLISSVTINAISPQRANNTAATTTGRDSSGPYVYFPYGWWPQNSSTYGSYTRLTEAQAIAAARTQAKTITSSTSEQTVTPATNYLLSKVIVKPLSMSGTYTPSSSNVNKSALDMGSTNTYRYVNTATCYSAGWEAAKAYCNVLNFQEVSEYVTYKDFGLSNLTKGAKYAIIALVFQHSGTYSGVGSGAKLTCVSGGSGLSASWSQAEAKSAQTSGNGGMVMWAYGTFTASSSSATIRLNTVSKISGYWKMWVVGVTNG